MPGNERRPERGPGAAETFGGVITIVPNTLTPADAEAWLECHRGHVLVEVEVGSNGHTRIYRYRSLDAVAGCLERAQARGASARVALVQTIPVGIVTGGAV